MLYGTSSWNNLTYAEKEEALSDITTEVLYCAISFDMLSVVSNTW